MNKLKPGEIRMVPRSDPAMAKITKIRDDFVEIAQAHGAGNDEYGTALVGALSALIYAVANGETVQRNVLVNMVIDGINRQFAVYDAAGGMQAAIRRDLEVRRK